VTKTVKANNSKTAGQKTSLMNIVLWCLIVACFIGGLVANYAYLPALSVYLRVAGWIILLIVMLGLTLLTSQGKRVHKFSKEARAEMRKVHWPTRQETIQTTLLVVAMVVLVGLVLWGIDAFFMWAVNLLTGQ
jgi:preprotein translocase subunit SecE